MKKNGEYDEEAKSDLEDFDEYQDQSMLVNGIGNIPETDDTVIQNCDDFDE